MNPDQSAKRNGISPRTKQYLIGAAGVVVLLLGALLIYSVLVTPEKQPYRTALAQYQRVYAANVAFTNAGAALGSTSTPTEAQVAANSQSIETAKNGLQTEADALGKQAVLQEGEGKNLYDAFAKTLKSYITHNTGIVASREKVRPVLASSDCSQALATTQSYASKEVPMRACADKIAAIKDVSDADYRTLVATYSREYEQLATLFVKFSGVTDTNSAEYTALVSEHEAILNTIEQANKTFASNLQQHKKSVDITDTAKALDEYLQRKSSIF